MVSKENSRWAHVSRTQFFFQSWKILRNTHTSKLGTMRIFIFLCWSFYYFWPKINNSLWYFLLFLVILYLFYVQLLGMFHSLFLCITFRDKFLGSYIFEDILQDFQLAYRIIHFICFKKKLLFEKVTRLIPISRLETKNGRSSQNTLWSNVLRHVLLSATHFLLPINYEIKLHILKKSNLSYLQKKFTKHTLKD